jgi:hypothetical protein
MDIRLRLSPGQARALRDILATTPHRQHDATLAPLWHALDRQLSAALCGKNTASPVDGRARSTVLSSD